MKIAKNYLILCITVMNIGGRITWALVWITCVVPGVLGQLGGVSNVTTFPDPEIK